MNKYMKKMIAVILMLFSLSFLFAACGKKEEAPETSSVEEETESMDVEESLSIELEEGQEGAAAPAE